MLKLLIGDPDRSLAAALARDFRLEGYDATESHDGADALRRAQVLRPDLLILDCELPIKDGLAVCREVRAGGRGRLTPLIVTGARRDDAAHLAAFDSGTDDYVPKPYSRKVMVMRVGRLLRARGSALPYGGPVIESQGVVLDARGHRACYRDRDLGLTPTEFRLLHVLMREPGRAFGRDALMDHAVGKLQSVLEGTINAYVKDLRKKLGDGGRLIETVRAVGYRFRKTGTG